MRWHAFVLVGLALGTAAGCSRSPSARTLEGHVGSVVAVAFSADGSRLVSVSDGVDRHKGPDPQGGEVRTWDAGKGQGETTWRLGIGVGPEGRGRLAISPDSRLLAFQGSDRAHPNEPIKVFEAGSGKEVAQVRQDTAALAFFPDGKRLAAVLDDRTSDARPVTITLWDPRTGKEQGTLRSKEPHHQVTSLAFSADGKVLAGAGEDSLILWDVDAKAERGSWKTPMGTVRCLAFSPDGNTLALGGPKALTVWDCAAGKGVRSIQGFEGELRAVAFARDGKILATGDDKGTRLWEAGTGQERASYPSKEGWVISLAFSPVGTTLAAGEGFSGRVSLWDISAVVGAALSPPQVPPESPAGGGGPAPLARNQPRSLAWKPVAPVAAGDLPRQLLVTGRETAVVGYVNVRAVDRVNLTNGQVLRIDYPGGGATLQDDKWIAASADGRWLACSLSPHALFRTDLPAGRLAGELDARLEGARYDSDPAVPSLLAVAPDGRVWGWSFNGHALCLYQDGARAQPLIPLAADDDLLCLRISPDGKRLYALGTSRIERGHVLLFLFDPATRMMVRRHDLGSAGTLFSPGPNGLAVSADGTTLAAYVGQRDLDGDRLPALQAFTAQELESPNPAGRTVPLPVWYSPRVGVGLSADGAQALAYMADFEGTHFVGRKYEGNKYRDLFTGYASSGQMLTLDLRKMEVSGLFNAGQVWTDAGAFVGLTGKDLPSLKAAAFGPDGTVYLLTRDAVLRLE